MQAEGRPHHLSHHQTTQQRGIAGPRHDRQPGRGGQQIGDKAHGGLARFAGPQAALAALIRRQPFREAHMGGQQVYQRNPPPRAQGKRLGAVAG